MNKLRIAKSLFPKFTKTSEDLDILLGLSLSPQLIFPVGIEDDFVEHCLVIIKTIEVLTAKDL